MTRARRRWTILGAMQLRPMLLGLALAACGGPARSTDTAPPAPPPSPTTIDTAIADAPAVATAGSDPCEGGEISGGEQGDGTGGGRLGGSHVTAPPTLTIGEPEVGAGLAAADVARVVRDNLGRLRLCYDNGLRADPTLAGRIVVAATVARDGTIKRVVDGGSELADAAVVSCMVRAFWGMTFPAPASGPVEIVASITVAPGG